MTTHSRTVAIGVLTVILSLTVPNRGLAGWLVLTNDTGRTLIVHELPDTKEQTRRKKPYHLHPGETLRLYLPTPTTKLIEVVDAARPGQTVWSGSLPCPASTQAFSLTTQAGEVVVASLPARK
jgi:hypothetical protein